ncbi:hypothetical protein DSO06_04965 [Candidatus Nezhaarchaeota archaeon WYZ-LMO8]|nr:MAG: hypothetical protein DSO06_04965 [Candidatus Nezhaarchaeota archaeon WYZ-LMO8]TDA35897.1 MAG: hypothetical protein DSO05_04490 [Candidatus Nezhaarchaeota archaeon WYZ-LMO7]
MLIFENSMKCAIICSALSNSAKRRILEILSRGPLALDTLAALTGVSEILIKDVINEMEGLGIVKTEIVEKRGVKKIFVKPLIPLYYEGAVGGLNKIVEETSHRMIEDFMKIVSDGIDEIEKAFNDNEGRYTISSILAYCFAAAYKKACEKLYSMWEEEYQDVVKTWIKEVTKDTKK